LLAAGVYATRERVLHPALCRLVPWLARRLGGVEVELGALHGDWWRELALEDLVVRAPESGLVQLAVDRLELEVDLPRALRGGLAGLDAARAGRARLELDLTARDEVAQPVPTAPAARLPARWPRIELARGDGRIALPGGVLAIEELALASESGQRVRWSGRARWDGEVDLAAPLAGTARAGGTELELGELVVGQVLRAGTGRVAWNGGGLAVELAGELPGAGRLSAELALGGGGELRGELELAAVELAPAVASVAAVGLTAATLETLAGRADLRARIAVPAGSEDFAARVELSGAAIAYAGRRVDGLELAGTLGRDAARVETLELRAGAQRVTAEDVALPFTDLDGFLRGLTGRIALDLERPAAWVPELADLLERFPAERLVASGVVERGTLRLDGARLEVPGGALELGAGKVDFVTGPDGGRQVELALDARLDDLALLAALGGPAGWSGTLACEGRLSGSIASPTLWARFEGRELAQAGLGLEATLGGWLDASGPWDAPALQVHLESDALRARDLALDALCLDARSDGGELAIDELAARADGVELHAAGRYRPDDGGGEDDGGGAGRVEIARLSLDVAGARTLEAGGSFPLAPGATELLAPGPIALRVRGDLRPDRPLVVPLPGGPWSARGSGWAQLDLGGTWRAPQGGLVGEARGLVLEGAGVAADLARASASFELGQRARLERLQLVGLAGGRATASGELGAPLDLARLAAGDAAALLDAPLDLALEAELEDLSGLAALAPSLRRVAGRARGDLWVTGTPARPHIEGGLALRDGLAKVGSLPELEALNVGLAWDGERLEVVEASGELGAAPFDVAGDVLWEEGRPVLALALRGDNLLLQRTGALRLRGDLDLTLGGPPDALSLAGSVRLRNSRFLQEVDFLSLLERRRGGAVQRGSGFALPAFRSAPLATLALDVDVTSAEPVRLIGNLARGDVSLDLHLGGTGEVLLPGGTAFVDALRVALPGGTMRFERGLVTLDAQDPTRPRLELVGESRLAGYDVTMELSGPIDEPRVELSSSPPLSRKDVLLLVMTGRVPPAGEATRSTATSLGLYLAKDLARRWASAPGLSEEEGLLDRLEILSGQDVSKSGVSTLEVSYRVWEDVFGESDSVYVVGERDVYEDFNIGLRLLFRGR